MGLLKLIDHFVLLIGILSGSNGVGAVEPKIFIHGTVLHCRSLDDVRMNLEVLKYCATVLFLVTCLYLVSLI